MDNTIQICSLNCRGLGDKQKRRDVFNYLRDKKYSIYCLQDIHSTKEVERYIKAEWGYKCYFSHGNSQSRGVAILFNNNFEFKVNQIENSQDGNLLALSLTVHNKDITLINLYGPNTDSPEFYDSVDDIIGRFENSYHIICGDWNLILNKERDTYNYRHINNPKARDRVLELINTFDLVDVWREQHLDEKRFTWRQPNPLKQARLDFFLVSPSIANIPFTSKIEPGYRSDHSLITLECNLEKEKAHGKGFWKFNNSLLYEKEYSEIVKEVINETILEYAATPYNREILLQMSREEIQFTINDKLFLEMLLMKIRGKTMAFSSKLKRGREKCENDIKGNLEKLESELANAVDNIFKNDIIKKLAIENNKLEQIRKNKVQGIIVRSKAKWVEHGEKPTKYFLALENRNFINKTICKIEQVNGKTLTDQKEIMQETTHFYKNLFTKRETDDINLSEILDNYVVPKLTTSMAESLEGKISYAELLNTLKYMKNDKSPGTDGFSAEFFKFFWRELNAFLLRSINEAYETNSMSISQTQGIITMLPKQDKPKQFLKNLRPISLLNVVYKLASGTIANRIKKVLPHLISEDQNGFMAGRYIGENTRVIFDILEYCETFQIPGLLMQIDFEKAFDSVDWDFIRKTLEFFGFGNFIIKWVNLFLKDSQSCVIVNGFPSTFFKLSRGCRQGDPISPYMFILCAEILSIMLKNNNNIKGINIHNEEFLLSQYADDTTIFLDGSETSLQSTLQTLNKYEKFSGLKINSQKTKVVWIGSMKNSKQILCSDFKLDWNPTNFKILGIEFSLNLQEMVEKNYKDKLKEIKKLMANWSTRYLTALGRNVVLKSLILPKLTHLFTSLPNPENKFVEELQKLCFKYIWNEKPDKVKREKMIQSYSSGGIKVLNIKNHMKALKLTWLRRCMTKNTKWQIFFLNSVKSEIHWSELGISKMNSFKQKISNPFWKQVIEAWCELLKQKNVNTRDSFLMEALWHNDNILVDNRPVYFKNWFVLGIKYVNDLLDCDGKYLQYNQFIKIHGIITNFVTFNGLLAALKRYQNKLNIESLNKKIAYPIKPVQISWIIKNQKGSNPFYNILNYSNMQKYKSMIKWENSLSLSLELDEWKIINNIPFVCTIDTKLRWFQFRITNRILSTNTFLHKIGIIENNLCSFCNAQPETLQHLFWDCEKISLIWIQLNNWIQSKSGVHINLSGKKVLLGVQGKHVQILNYFIIVVKYHIYKCSFQKCLPHMEGIKRELNYAYSIEKYISKKNMEIDKFNKKWSSFHLLFK